jgi:putative hydrolase of the HAD superfamily
MNGAPFRVIIHKSINPLIQSSPIRAITFDVGGTLIEPWPSVGHIYASVAARHGLLNLPIEILNRQFAAAWKNLAQFNYTRSEWFQLVSQSFSGIIETPLNEVLFAELYSHFGRPEAWRIFDDVIPTLEVLRSSGLRLGIISNWDERLRPLLHELKLAPYFHAIVISCEVGVCKPSAAIFQQAAQELGAQPAEILHVGDSPAMDIEGADSADFLSVLLSRGKETELPEINSLVELQPLASRQ